MMMHGVAAGAALFFFLAIGAVALFTFLSVATWAGTRQAERETYYKAELMKRIAEIGGDRNPAIDYLREQERIAARHRREGFKIGGLINICVGIALTLLLGGLVHKAPVYLVGTIPVGIGAALLIYVFWMMPPEQS